MSILSTVSITKRLRVVPPEGEESALSVRFPPGSSDSPPYPLSQATRRNGAQHATARESVERWGWDVELIERMGTTVVEVVGLSRTVCYVEDVDVAMIRAGLDDEALDRAAAWLLAEITRPATSSAP